jgi:hypothetical protein
LGHQDLTRWHLLAVDLAEQVGKESRLIDVLNSFDNRSQAAHHPPPTNMQDLQRSLQLIAVKGDQVEVLSPIGDDFLPLDRSFDIAESIAISSGALILLVGRGCQHATTQTSSYLLGVSSQEGG